MTANQFLPDGFLKQLGWGLMDQRKRRDGFPDWWSQVVRIYTAANLTFIQDKFPAISGVARESQEMTGSTYLAGMWKEHDLEAHLCWSTVSQQLRPTWRAPTWSWMSVDGAVSYGSDNRHGFRENLAHILDVDMKFATEDLFGEILEGLLRIACRGVVIAEHKGENILKIKANQDDPEDELEIPIVVDCSDKWPAGNNDAAYLLPILDGDTGFSSRDHTGKRIRKYEVCGLVLQREDGKVGWFHRVGIFRLWTNAPWYQHPYNDKRESLLRLLEQSSNMKKQGVFAEILEHPAIPEEKYVLNIH